MVVVNNTQATHSDQLTGAIKRISVLEELHQDSLCRGELERCLDVSTPTFYRYLNWLKDRGLIQESTDEITLTKMGEILLDEITRFETTVLTALQNAENDRDLLLDIIRHKSGLEALTNHPRDRRELERQLDVSRTTSYRFTRSFEKVGVIEKSEGKYALTAAGDEVVAAVDALETTAQTAIRLEPVLEVVDDTAYAFDLEAFAGATVTTTDQGDAHSPVNRAIALLQETDSLRAVDMNSIAPIYLSDIQQLIIEGMETINIQTPEAIANILVEYPEKCIEACESGNVTVLLHEGLPYGLLILDDRVGIGIRDEDSRTLQMFVDTDSSGAREWAEAVFESYKANSVEMVGFSPWTFRRAMERLSPDHAVTVDR